MWRVTVICVKSTVLYAAYACHQYPLVKVVARSARLVLRTYTRVVLSAHSLTTDFDY